MKRYTAVYEKHDKWYVGYVQGVHGANTQGKTLKEARENLQEALELVLEANRHFASQAKKPIQVIREPILIQTS